MLTADLALKADPAYRHIAERFRRTRRFARAWFKLTHRDMGPTFRYLGSAVPAEALSWQDSVPAVDHALIDAQDVALLKSQILASGLTVPELVRTEPA